MSNMMLGALLSFIAAYLLVVIFLLKTAIANGWSSFNAATILIGAPLYTLVHVYWLLIPIGLVLGATIPLLVSKRTKREAVVYGIVTGIIIGLLVTWFSAYDFAVGTSIVPDDSGKWWGRFWDGFGMSAPLLIIYCSIWTGAYSFIKAGAGGDEPESDLTSE